MAENESIIDQASKYVYRLFKDQIPIDLVYHNHTHTKEVYDYAKELSEDMDLREEDRTALYLAAWFHDTGYVTKYRGHEEESIRIFEEFASKENISQDIQETVIRLIRCTEYGEVPSDKLEEVIHDADIAHVGTDRFFEKAELLRVEWEKHCNRTYDNIQWAELQVNFLVESKFYTREAINKFGQQREENISEQREDLVKKKKKKLKTDKKLKKLGRGVETMYRATYRNHINLSSIADAKANMMISINTIIMSVIITLSGSQFTLSNQSFVEHIRFTVPIMVLLLGALISVIFAILSARPEVTSKKVDKQKIKENKSSVLFFGNYVNMPLQEFIDHLEDFRNKQEKLYDNMTVDLYYLGIVLTRKYKLLRWSYNIFMGALIGAVVTFIGIFWYTTYSDF